MWVDGKVLDRGRVTHAWILGIMGERKRKHSTKRYGYDSLGALKALLRCSVLGSDLIPQCKQSTFPALWEIAYI